MKSLERKDILKVRTYKPGKPIQEVKRELGLRSVIKIASNENALSPPAGVSRAIKKGIGALNRYPEGGCFYLKRALAKKFSLPAKNIIIGNGSDELIIMALRAFAEKGDEVIVSDPTFLIYEIASTIAGVKIVKVPAKGMRYDIPGMIRRLSGKTKIVFIANPDNPLGTYVTGKEVKSLLSKVGPRTIVFFDEAYFEFAAGLKDYPKTLPYLNKKNVIITRTFSKVYALAGLRVGYGFARKSLIEAMDKVREPFNVNSLAQIAAVEALKDSAFVSRSLKLVRDGKKYISRQLDSLGYAYLDSATNFMLINVGRDAEAVYGKLLRKGVIVREMSAWRLKGYLRVTTGTMAESRRFIKAFKEVCRKPQT